jgi:DNA-binding MarR family transcriptional regulator
MSGVRESAVVEAPVADAESRLHEDDHDALRLWLRLLTCTSLIERRIRAELRESFAMTLPRFDLMAQLERAPDGLKMSELSRRLMVTGGNVTGLTDQLVSEGLVVRKRVSGDRRVQAISLTREGRKVFRTMAEAHERWVVALLSGLSPGERDRLYALLGRLKRGVAAMPPQETS